MASKTEQSKNSKFRSLCLPAVVIAFLLTTAALLMAFLVIPPVGGASVEGAVLVGDTMVSQVMLISQKIFYFHMPVALVSFIALGFGAYFALRYLMTRKHSYDLCSKTALEIALLFVLLTMITGELWTRFEWGVWWTWEPRLTTYLILMLIVIAYFILRNAVDEPEKQSTFAAVVAILAFIDVPICFLVTRLIPSSVHPVVLREGGLSPEMGICVGLATLGMALLAFVLYQLRFGSVSLNERIQAVKDRLDSQESQ